MISTTVGGTALTASDTSATRRDPAGRVHYDLFDTLRIAASLLVVYFHSYALTGHSDPVVPLFGRAGLGYGSIAVGAFFAMSGFMVTASWSRSSAPVFARNRIARIYPGIIAVVVLSTFVVGPLVSQISPSSYFKQGLTWSYLVHTSSLFPVLYHLPGVFAHNPYPTAVNGSLWTLTYEVSAYVCLAALGIVGLLRPRSILVVLGATAVLDVLAIQFDVIHQHTFHSFTVVDSVSLALFFEIGAACYLYRDLALGHRRISGALVVAAIVGGGFARSQALMSVGIGVGVVLVGSMPSQPARSLRRLGDPSYGIYIYAFVIQQMLAWGHVTRSPLVMFALASLASVAAGYASWHLIEKPVMDWAKNRFPAAARRRVQPNVDQPRLVQTSAGTSTSDLR